MSEVFVGDVGTELLLDCGTDISTATLVKIIARTPRGNKKEWVGTIQGTTLVRYVVGAGDLDYPGNWALQVYVEMPGWSGRGALATLKVSQ